MPAADAQTQFLAQGEPQTEPTEQADLTAQCRQAGTRISQLLDHLEQVIQGKREVLEKVLTCLLSGGHVLLEDLPGVGKTTLAKALARALADCHYRRIQFTPDLLPYDVTGVEVWRPDRHCFEFHPGPVFCNLLLADEINRATPKVQSALLEVMAEQQVTVGQESHLLEGPFWVIATQNPIEMAGTYILPKAQLDRFSMRLSLGYPDFAHELAVVQGDPSHRSLPGLSALLDRSEVMGLQALAAEVYCAPKLQEWMVQVAHDIRASPAVRLGVSTRAVLMWLACARAYALTQGRSYVLDQDVLLLAPAVLSHRMELRQQHDRAEAVVEQLLREAQKRLP